MFNLSAKTSVMFPVNVSRLSWKSLNLQQKVDDHLLCNTLKSVRSVAGAILALFVK